MGHILETRAPIVGNDRQTLMCWDAPFGFVATEDDRRLSGNLVAEFILKAVAMAILVAIGWTWVFAPGQYLAAFENKLVLSAGFALVGFGLYRHADKGFRSELQVNPGKRELRLVTRNSRDMGFVRQALPMREVQSMYLKRTAGTVPKAQLMIRIRNQALPVPSVAGLETEVASFRDRLARELSRPKTRIVTRVIKPSNEKRKPAANWESAEAKAG